MASVKFFVMNMRVHIRVKGRVQGVGFRFECQRLAIQMGLQGWVKNLADGSVEIVAEGEQARLDRLAQWSRRGPAGAYVEICHVSSEPPTGEIRTFEVRF